MVYDHCGTLGVGLLPQFRGKGIGRKLMQRTIDAAFDGQGKKRQCYCLI
jgi:GNAT superfamily N-acetyltransferase